MAGAMIIEGNWWDENELKGRGCGVCGKPLPKDSKEIICEPGTGCRKGNNDSLFDDPSVWGDDDAGR